MADKPQNFENHTRVVPGFHFYVFGVFVLNVVYAVIHLWLHHWPVAVLNLLVAVALLMLFFYTRQFATTLQDRIIRLEMRLRLREVLPPELRPRIAELTPKQLVALRFASDAELPALVADVLAGKYPDQKSITRAVKDWQADTLRV